MSVARSPRPGRQCDEHSAVEWQRLVRARCQPQWPGFGRCLFRTNVLYVGGSFTNLGSVKSHEPRRLERQRVVGLGGGERDCSRPGLARHQPLRRRRLHQRGPGQRQPRGKMGTATIGLPWAPGYRVLAPAANSAFPTWPLTPSAASMSRATSTSPARSARVTSLDGMAQTGLPWALRPAKA